jgi:hypothetical protein
MMIPYASEYIPGKMQRIPKPVQAAMISALIIGIICHIQALTQQILNHDTVTTLGEDGMWLLTQGKWFFGYLGILRGSIATSGIETTLALLFLSVCAGLTTSVLRIKTSLHGAIIGAVLVSFPSVFCNMLYLGEEIFYTALMMAILAVYFTVKYKYGFIGGIVLLTLSTGTYQAYIGYAAGLFVLLSLLDILENKKKTKEILLNGLKYVGVLFAAIILYYVCLQILLVVRDTELSAYQGISSFDDITLRGTLILIRDAYLASVNFMMFDTYGISGFFVLLYRLVIFANTILLALISIKTKLYKKIHMLLLGIVLYGVALPLSVHAVAVLGQNVNTHWMMKYPLVLMFIAMIVLLDQYVSLYKEKQDADTKSKQNMLAITQWLVLVLSILLVYNWFILANQCYQKMRNVNGVIYAKTTGLVQDIYESEDYSDNIQVAFVGDPPYEFASDPKIVFDKYQKFTGYDNPDDVFYNDIIIDLYMKNYLGASFNFIVRADVELMYNEEIMNMNVYPENGSIQKIGEILVVKVGEIEEQT